MSTKLSVASPKWSERIKFSFRGKKCETARFRCQRRCIKVPRQCRKCEIPKKVFLWCWKSVLKCSVLNVWFLCLLFQSIEVWSDGKQIQNTKWDAYRSNQKNLLLPKATRSICRHRDDPGPGLGSNQVFLLCTLKEKGEVGSYGDQIENTERDTYKSRNENLYLPKAPLSSPGYLERFELGPNLAPGHCTLITGVELMMCKEKRPKYTYRDAYNPNPIGQLAYSVTQLNPDGKWLKGKQLGSRDRALEDSNTGVFWGTERVTPKKTYWDTNDREQLSLSPMVPQRSPSRKQKLAHITSRYLSVDPQRPTMSKIKVAYKYSRHPAKTVLYDYLNISLNSQKPNLEPLLFSYRKLLGTKPRKNVELEHRCGTRKFNAEVQNEMKSERHVIAIARWRLLKASDVESNPGPEDKRPETKLTLITQNCRGLKDDRKLKHLLNNCHNVTKSSRDYVIALQETMITDDQRIKFGWRGSHIFTPGSGHGRGCVTLLPSHIQPDAQTIVHLGQRGHIFKASINQNTAIVANVYAPNGLNRDKIEFFSKLKREIERLRDPSDDVFVMGDLNTVFEPFEVQFRSYSLQEQRHSRIIKQIIDSLALEDVWQQDKVSLTWRQPGSRKSSRLDRIYYQHRLEKLECIVDWTFTNSDHGAVKVTFCDPNRANQRTQKPLKMNPALLNVKTFRESFMLEYSRQVQQIPANWNPHQVLEFHKCAMRSAYIEINRTFKKRQRTDYDFIKEDLNSHIAALEACKGDAAKANRLMEKINRLKAEIAKLNLEKGTSLANKLKTKWYNEGERSNKYFLALLRRREANGQLTKLTIDNREVSEPKEIESHVTNFYRTLYNQPEEPYSEEEKENLLDHMERLTDEEKEMVSRPLTLADISKTLKNTNDSCPGPDGIPYSYLKATWNLFGMVLLNAWHYSVQEKCLPLSHRTSVLRLIPKAGKNVQELKNWRPITLSNCDHKVITKTLSRVMSSGIERIISGNQTAYLRGRSISDNLRLVNLANNIAKKDRRAKGLLIALDAKKAFDSVNHKYIKEILKKIGLESFIATFELLYDHSQVDISINDKICKGYKIGNGVKQGDALSCTLFILAMEPLLRNIESNRDIESFKSANLGITMPKCLGYADDINVITTDSINNVRATMKEYERFSKVSGLHLNADKTEIFKLTGTFSAENYSFTYRGERTMIANVRKIKVNGIELTTDLEETHKLNFDSVKQKVDSQLASWSNRGLSILGKILIYKTYGLSQIIYVSRVFRFTKLEHSILRNLVYKFIWNRNYQLAKAPDRIKRQYMNNPIKKGGFGMVDHEEVVTAMNTKQVLVNRASSHPLNSILRTLMTDPESSFNVEMPCGLDGPSENYAHTIKRINQTLLLKEPDYLQQDRLAQDMLLKEKLKNLARSERKNCIELTLLRHQGITTLRQLLLGNPQMTNRFRMQILHYRYSTLMDACLLNPTQQPVTEHYIPIAKGYRLAEKTTSKELRLLTDHGHPMINFKLQIDHEDISNMLPKINKLKCTRAKTLALRLLHGDVYTGTRLYKFGLTDTDECCKCRHSENLSHLLLDCWYPGIIWSKVKNLYSKTDSRRQRYESDLEFVVGAKLSKAKLKLHLEIIRRLCNKERPNILPRALIGHSLDYLIICDNEHFKYYKKLKAAL